MPEPTIDEIKTICTFVQRVNRRFDAMRQHNRNLKPNVTYRECVVIELAVMDCLTYAAGEGEANA